MDNPVVLLKSSVNEITAFSKRNTLRLAMIVDLKDAAKACRTKEARGLIEGLLAPLQKELQKEAAAFDSKMSSIWSKAKGEKLPPDIQKKLDDALKNTTKDMQSKSGQDIKYNSSHVHKKWIDIY